jgi:RHS repeat-associated protein
VVALTSNTGNVTYAAAYNAYGTHATVTTSNVTTTGTQEVGTDTDAFRTNTREEWDSADGTAFVKEGHRIRDLNTDTYETRDPLGQVAGPNPYTYVGQDEWTKTDPLGLQPPVAAGALLIGDFTPEPAAPAFWIATGVTLLVGTGAVIVTHPGLIHPQMTPTSDQQPASTPPAGLVPKQTIVLPNVPGEPGKSTGGFTQAEPLPAQPGFTSAPPPPVTTPGHMDTPSGGAAGADILNSVLQGDAGNQTANQTPWAARREAMRAAGIPTSQQPTGQTSVTAPDGSPAGRQYTYVTPQPGGGTQTQSVQHSLTDEDHDAHWEAGPVKPSGQTDSLGRPRLTNDKVKVDDPGTTSNQL